MIKKFDTSHYEHVMCIRLGNGFMGKRQAIEFHRIFGAEIVWRNNQYMVIVNIPDRETYEIVSNYNDYIFGRKMYQEKIH